MTPLLFILLALLIPLLTTLLLLAAVGIGLFGARRLLRRWSTQPVEDTPVQLPLSLASTPPETVLILQQRAETGDLVLRPMGSRRPADNLDALDLVPAQLARPPESITANVDLAVELCPRAPQPVNLELPVYISGMGYGLALSRGAKLALVRGSALARTAVNSGEGAFLPEEPVLAHRWFYQVGRGEWTHRPDLVRQADLVEIHAGQGSEFGAPLTRPPGRVAAELRGSMGLAGSRPATIHAGLHWRGRAVTLAQLVTLLRGINPDCPIGVKLGGSDAIEADLAAALRAGVDFVAVDGEEAGTGNAPIALTESVGIPLLHALDRAVKLLEALDLRGRVTLIASGGLREPADFIKALALGADAVAIGSAALIAIAHRQVEGILPRPPLRLVMHGAPEAERFNVEQGAHSLANFLESCRKEMQLLLRALGKRRVGELGRSDLCCGDPVLARRLGVHCSLEPLSPALAELRRIADGARRANADLNALIGRGGRHGAPSSVTAAPRTR